VETAKRRGEEIRRDEKKEKKPSSHALAFSGTHLSVTQQQDASLAEAFPWVDRQAEYRKADAWMEANPTKRPKSQGKFTYNWICKIDPPTNGRRQTAAEARDEHTDKVIEDYKRNHGLTGSG